MIPCPKCGKKSHVIDSRVRDDKASVRRRRRCLVGTCGYAWTTREVSLAKIALTERMMRAIQRVQAALQDEPIGED